MDYIKIVMISSLVVEYKTINEKLAIITNNNKGGLDLWNMKED